MTKKKDEHRKEGKENHISQNPQENSANIGEKEVEQNGIEDANGISDAAIGLENKITELNDQLAAANDKYLRLSAEIDNFRKRTLREKMDLMKNASESIIVNFLPVLDEKK